LGLPSFVPRVLEETDEYKVSINRYGFVQKDTKIYTLQSAGYQAYHYIDTPTKIREDWESYKKRYNPKEARRFPTYWGDELFEYYKTLDVPIRLDFVWGPGRVPKAGYTMGVEKFLQTIWKVTNLTKKKDHSNLRFLLLLMAPFLIIDRHLFLSSSSSSSTLPSRPLKISMNADRKIVTESTPPLYTFFLQRGPTKQRESTIRWETYEN
jgi:hypothetical protein